MKKSNLFKRMTVYVKKTNELVEKKENKRKEVVGGETVKAVSFT